MVNGKGLVDILRFCGGVAPFGGNLVVGDGIGSANSAIVKSLQANEIPDATSVTVQSDGLLDGNNWQVNPVSVFLGVWWLYDAVNTLRGYAALNRAD